MEMEIARAKEWEKKIDDVGLSIFFVGFWGLVLFIDCQYFFSHHIYTASQEKLAILLNSFLLFDLVCRNPVMVGKIVTKVIGLCDAHPWIPPFVIRLIMMYAKFGEEAIEDALDLEAIEERRNAPSRPFDDVLRDMKRDGLL